MLSHVRPASCGRKASRTGMTLRFAQRPQSLAARSAIANKKGGLRHLINNNEVLEHSYRLHDASEIRSNSYS